MSLSIQRIFPGRLEVAYQEERNRLQAGETIKRMWAKQPALWKDDAAHAKVIANRLGWMGVVDMMRAEVPALTAFEREVTASGIRDIVLLGMGGSSLAPEVFSLTFPAPASGRRMIILDTTDPEALIEVSQTLELKSTLFVVASKSGKTIETLSQFHYFLNRLNQSGIRDAGPHFIAITDSGSYLDHLAQEHKFRKTFLNPQDIGGRYSALSYFGLVPAALWNINIAAVLDSAIEMRTACSPAADLGKNPAFELGALLGAGAKHGDDKLVLLSAAKLTPLGNWIEQLIAESTGKEGKGVVPVAGGALPPVDVLAQGCVSVALILEGEDDAPLRSTLQQLAQRGAPYVEIRLGSPNELGAEFFKWETATAVTGAALSIDPFDEPNVQESKDATARILEEFQTAGKMPLGTPRIAENGIEIYADGDTRTALSTLNMAEALRTFFGERGAGDYVAILAYVARDAVNSAALNGLRLILSAKLGLPVLLGFGPRYMHSIGQLYKGGPPSGMFLVITSEKSEDLAIPGAKYTFGQLEMAQALGDLQSLNQRGKPSLRVHLTAGAAGGLEHLRQLIEQALPAARQAIR